MKKQIINQFKIRLLEEKHSTLESIYLMDKNIGNKKEFSTELFMIGQNISLKNNVENILYKIDSALDKVKTEDYGIYEDCGKNIDKDRLDILPYALKCIKCEYDNSEEPFMGQIINEYFTFGRTFTEESESDPVIFDGEDSWQSVNDYNVVAKHPSFSTGDYIGLVDEDEIGAVEEVEKISEEYYKKQL